MDSLTTRALTLYRRGLFGASWKEWERLGQMARDAGSRHAYLQARNGATACADGLRLTDDALVLARRAVAAATGMPEDLPVVRRALSNLVIVSAQVGAFTEAMEILERAERTEVNGQDPVGATLPLLRLNILVERGEYERAAELAQCVRACLTGDLNAVRAHHDEALIVLETEGPARALPLFVNLLRPMRSLGTDRDELALLADLTEVYALLGDAEGVMSTHKAAQQLIERTTSVLNGVELARVAALDAFGLALTGEVRAVGQRLAQVRELLGTYGRTNRAERVAVRIVRFMADVAGSRADLLGRDELGRYLSSPYVAEMDFRRAEMASLAAYVTSVAPKLADVDVALLGQAATSPLTARSVLLRELAARRTSGSDVPAEAKVLSLLRAYTLGTRTADYTDVLNTLRGASRRHYDQEIVERFIDLHVA